MISCHRAPAISRVKQMERGSPFEDLKEMASLPNDWSICKAINLNRQHTFGGTIVVMPSNKSSRFRQSQTQPYQWRTLFLELLYGLLIIAWYFLALAERFALIGLTRLEKGALSSSDDPSENSGVLETGSKFRHNLFKIA